VLGSVRSVPHSFRLLTAGLALLAACTDPVDRAAKERIFSPEDPPPVVASAKESLDAQKLASDPKLAHRVLDMGPAEGLEVVRARGQVFARSKYGKYRLRLRDRGMAERTRDETAGALREMDGLFQGRLDLALDGPTSVEGRPAIRYTVKLVDAAPQVKGARIETPPAAAYARGGLDEDSARRQRFIDQRQPKKLGGEVLVDSATGVVLRAHLDGTLAVASGPGTGPAQLHVLLDQRIRDVGKPISIQVPEGHLPDADKPEGIADALDRFGIQRQGSPDAGVDDEADEDSSG